jgi:hypothetical protein
MVSIKINSFSLIVYNIIRIIGLCTWYYGHCDDPTSAYGIRHFTRGKGIIPALV